MRVWLHVDSLETGGLEKKVETIATSLPRDRFEPYVSWSFKNGEIADRLSQRGVPVAFLDLRPQSRHESLKTLADAAPHVFHSFGCSRHSHDVALAAEAGVPYIVTNRSNIRHWDPALQIQPWETRRNALTHRVTACCQAVADCCTRVEGVPVTSVATIMNGVTTAPPSASASGLRQELGLGDDVFVVGYLARYHALKAHDALLRAFATVLAARPASHLICAGPCARGVKKSVAALASELGISHKVSLLDARFDVSSIYSALNLYAHPSMSEGLSNSILEAMAHRLPVVATDVGGTAEAVVNDVTGALVPPGDVDALAAAIMRVVHDPDLARGWAEEGLVRVRSRFSVAAMIKGYEDVYDGSL